MLLLGASNLTVLTPLPGVALVVGGNFAAFGVNSETLDVELSSVVSGDGTSSGTTWTDDAAFDFTAIGDLEDGVLVIGASEYDIVSLNAGNVVVSTPIAEASGSYSIRGTLTLRLLGEGSTVTATTSASDLSNATGNIVVSTGDNAGTYAIVEATANTLLVSGASVSLTYSTGLTTSAVITSIQTPESVADQLIANAVEVDEVFGRAHDSNAFAVWDETLPTFVATVTGPRASEITVTETASGKYLQDDFGRAIPPQYSESVIVASVQPASGFDRTLVQEQFGATAQFKGYTTSAIQITDHTTEEPGMLALLGGQRYRMISRAEWTSLLAHTKFYLVRELEDYADRFIQ